MRAHVTKTIPAMFCNHANECPMSCPCSASCYCRTHTCKRTPRIADLEHVRDQLQTLKAHVVEVNVARSDEPDDAYFWRCSCGKTGPLKHYSRSARNGGAKHVAAMERGR